MTAPAIPEGPLVDGNGNLTPAWREFFNEIRRLIDELLEAP